MDKRGEMMEKMDDLEVDITELRLKDLWRMRIFDLNKISYFYTLSDPFTSEIVYVGMTDSWHLRRREVNDPFKFPVLSEYMANYLFQLNSLKAEPDIKVIKIYLFDGLRAS
jgi:cytochrome c biogenesis protein ResB